MNDATTPPPDRLIPLQEVCTITGLSRPYIYRLVRKGRFPIQFKPGGYASRWSEAEVRAWVARQRVERAA